MSNNNVLEALKNSPEVRKLATIYIKSLYQKMFGNNASLNTSDALVLISSDLLGMMNFLDKYKVRIGITPVDNEEEEEFIGIIGEESYSFPSRVKACEEMCRIGVLKLEETLKENVE